MNTLSSHLELRKDEDVLWLDQRAKDVGETDLARFRNLVKESVARGWELLDARNYAYGRLMGSKLWSAGATGRW
jgi:hypothetical protein